MPPVFSAHRRVASDPGPASSSRRPARAVARSTARIPYPSQPAARQDLRAKTRSRVASSSSAITSLGSAIGCGLGGGRQVLGEIDWWTIMAGQLPSNSSRTSFSSDVGSIISSSASSVYAASLTGELNCSGVGPGLDADAAAEGFAMDLDGELVLATSTALPLSRACSRPTTPTFFWSSPASLSIPHSPSASSLRSTPQISVLSSPTSTATTSAPATPGRSISSSPIRKSFLKRAKSFAGLSRRSRSASTASSTARISMGAANEASKRVINLKRL